jgi:CBS domain-containing protein
MAQTVADITEPDAPTVTPGTRVEDVVSLFRELDVPAFPVVEEKLKKAAASTVEDLMSEDPVTIEPTATVLEAAHPIAQRDHSRLPVVEHGRYLGLVSRADVLGALSAER